MALLRVFDWGTETEIEVEFEPTVSSFGLAESLRVLPLAAREAWIVGIGDSGKQAYRVWLRDLRTLAEIDSREVAGSLHPEEICLSLDARKPSSILAAGATMTADPIDIWPWGPSYAGSEHVLIGRPRHGDSSYLWDSWATDCSELVSAEVRMELRGGVPPLPNGVDLSDCYVRWRESGALIVISPSGLCFARAGHGKLSNPAPAPTSYANRHWSDLEIWSLSPERSIAEGRVKDIDDFIMTLRFSRDSKFLVTGHRAGDIRVWQLPDPLPN